MPKENEIVIEMIDGQSVMSVDDFDEDDTETMEFKSI